MFASSSHRWREQHDEKCQASWIDCGCGTVNGRSIVPPFHTGDGLVGIPRPCRSQSWAAAYTHERSRGPPQGSSPRLLWSGCGRSGGGRRRGLWCVSLPEGMWVLSESTLLMTHARGSSLLSNCLRLRRTSCSTPSAERFKSLPRNRTARALVAFTQPQEDRMDMREASAMTEASGLTDEQDGRETPGSDTPIEMHSDRPLSRISDVLRKITLAAPLSSLFIAFLAGIMLARRR